MITRPSSLVIVFWAMLFVVIAFPLQAAVLYGHGLGEVTAIIGKISLANWITIVMLLVTSYLVLEASPFVKLAVPSAILVTGWNNYIVGAYNTDFSILTTSLASLGFSVLFVPLLTKEAREVLMDSSRRWWLRPKRFRTQISATLNPFVGQTIHAQTFDMSSGGAFIELAESIDPNNLPKVGERIRLSLNISPMRKIRVDAVIVRSAEPSGRYPKGIGLKFVDVERDNQKDIDRYLNSSRDLTIL